ncbi:hypothetical protein D1872_318210 [compost metagenome]
MNDGFLRTRQLYNMTFLVKAMHCNLIPRLDTSAASTLANSRFLLALLGSCLLKLLAGRDQSVLLH